MAGFAFVPGAIGRLPTKSKTLRESTCPQRKLGTVKAVQVSYREQEVGRSLEKLEEKLLHRRGPRPFRYGARKALMSPFFDKQLLLLALPALGSSVMEPMLSLVDSAFVASLGSAQLASLAPCNGIFSLIGGLSYYMLTCATSVIIARALGEGKRRDAKVVCKYVMLSGVIVGTLLTIFLAGYTSGVLQVLGCSASIMTHAVSYLRWRAVGIPFAFISLAAGGAFRAVRDTKTVFIVSLVAGIANVLLDAFLVVGLGDGVRGAALATSISQVIAGATAAFIFWKRREEFGFDKNSKEPEEEESSSIEESLTDLKLSSGTVMFRQLANNGLWLLSTALVTRLGNSEAATHHAMITVWLILSFINECIATAAQVMVAGVLFRKEGAYTCKARRIATRSLGMSLACAALLIPAGLISQETVVKGMLRTPETLQLLRKTFPLILTMMPIQFTVWTLDSVFNGASDFTYNAIAVAISASVCVAALLVWGKSLFSVWVIMAGLFFGLRLVLHVLRFFSKDGPFIPPQKTVHALNPVQ